MENLSFHHISVLLNECIEGLDIKPDGVYVDGTVGGAGHSFEIAKRLKNGKLICLDQDPEAIITAINRLSEFNNVSIVKSNFADLDTVLIDLDCPKVDGVLLDLGVSSHQLDSDYRGFSYHMDAPLDMRMSKEGISARDIVNDFPVSRIIKIIDEFSEEKYARSIGFNIDRCRKEKPIETTLELVEIIKSSMPESAKRDKNPCKKTFQALRIAVNSELEVLTSTIESAFERLNIGGRLVIITFHSLEDRIVKQKFKKLCEGCTCPKEFPVCICNKLPLAKLVNRKPIIATQNELEINNRSRSAKLRILERIR
jgi:16S rRNA (cytosine1402-N4)-methyltransferase